MARSWISNLGTMLMLPAVLLFGASVLVKPAISLPLSEAIVDQVEFFSAVAGVAGVGLLILVWLFGRLFRTPGIRKG